MPDAGKFLGPPLTANYRPAVLGYGMIQSLYTGQVPLFMLGEVEAMRSDPKIQLSVALLRAPLHKLKWKVRASSSAVGRYVDAQFRKVWTTCARRLIHYVEYGNAAGEPCWKQENGYVVFEQLRDVYPRDAVPLMQNGGVVGVQVKGSQPVSAPEGGEGAGKGLLNLFAPRAFWVAHRPRNGSPYGYSRYAGAWWPWLEKRGRHGATDIRRLWFIKNAFRGMRIRHPPGMMERPDGSLVSCQDYAREIVEKAETGGVLALPNAKDPTTGEYLWTVEDAAVNGQLTGVREYSGDLDREILEGFEIPPEVAAAAEVGGGWSGRSVPFLVFLAGEDEIVAELVHAITTWILRPGVEVNFGPGHFFCVEPESLTTLLDAPGKDQGGEGSGGGQPAQPTPPAPGAERPPTAVRVQMSLEADRGERESAAAVVDRIIDQGAQAGILAADRVRRQIAGLVRKGVQGDKLLAASRRLLAWYEPVLASAFSDSLLAGWLAGAARATKGLPPVPAPGTEPPSPAPPAAGTPPDLFAGGDPGGSPPILSTFRREGEPEPVIRLPLIEAAARDLLGRRIVTRDEFDRLAEEAKGAAFTAARVASEEALGRLASALAGVVGEGGTLGDFRAAVADALGEGALSPGHVENVFRTNVAAAYSTGLMETLAHPLVADEFPYLQYSAVHDSRTRHEHREMERLGLNGTSIFRRDDPVWQLFTPPWDYQCRCALIPVSVEDAAAAGVREAREWLQTGLPPARPEWVQPPPFSPPPGWSTRPAVRMALDDEGHEHDKLGRFAPKGQGGTATLDRPKKRKKTADATKGGRQEGGDGKGPAPAAAANKAGKELQRGLKGLVRNFGRRASVETRKAEHAVARKLGPKIWGKLPRAVQKSIGFTKAVSDKVLYAIDTPLRMGLNLAKTVARERGLPEEHVQKVARVVNAIDQLSTLPVVGVYTHAAKRLIPAIGPVAGYIPVAALSYVAYSTARNPFATIRAARHLMRNFKATVTTHMALGGDTDAVAALLEAYERHKGDDWFDALLHAALDQTKDLAAAVKAAEEALFFNPEGPGDEPGAKE